MKKAYISNQFGFSETGRYLLDNLFYPKFRECGIEILDPFVECSKHLDFDFLKSIDDKPYWQVKEFWDKFNSIVTLTNNYFMDKSDCMIALLDGGHTVDDGVASEIGYYQGQYKPIFALRTDLRLADNLGTSINSQILGYVRKDRLYNSFDELIVALQNWNK